LEIFSLPTFALESLNRIFMRYMENWLNTFSSSWYGLSWYHFSSIVGAWTLRTVIPACWFKKILTFTQILMKVEQWLITYMYKYSCGNLPQSSFTLSASLWKSCRLAGRV
jgi:hypothetical protein